MCFSDAFSQRTSHADVAFTAGAMTSSSISYHNTWRPNFGPKRRFEIGLGLRYSNAFKKEAEFITSGPAKYTRGSDVPIAVVFSDQRPENWDTLTVQKPFVHAVNLCLDLGFNFTEKFSFGFNIDLIGFSFGSEKSAYLTLDQFRNLDKVKPYAFNALLTGDLDLGTLNSEFFLRYKITEKWAVRGIFQFLFSEYETQNVEQTFSDGEINKRFRNKANNFGVGLSYYF